LLTVFAFTAGGAKGFPKQLNIVKGKSRGAIIGVIDNGIGADEIEITFKKEGKPNQYRVKGNKEGLFVLNRKEGVYNLTKYKYIKKSEGTVEIKFEKPLSLTIKQGQAVYIGRLFSSPIDGKIYLIDEYVRDIFGQQYMVIDKVSQLPEKLPKLFMSLTK